MYRDELGPGPDLTDRTYIYVNVSSYTKYLANLFHVYFELMRDASRAILR